MSESTQDEARAELVTATRLREEAEPRWRKAVLAALSVELGPTEVGRLAKVTRGRVIQIRNEAKETQR